MIKKYWKILMFLYLINHFLMRFATDLPDIIRIASMFTFDIIFVLDYNMRKCKWLD